MSNLPETRMGRITKKTWTPEQEAILRRLAGDGASVLRIAAAVRKSTSGVACRARALGIKIRSNREIRSHLREQQRALQ